MQLIENSLEEMPSSQPALLTAKDLVKTYGTTVAVNHMNLSIQPGQVIGLVGANGAGKSTLMRMISGVTVPDTGTITFSRKPIDASHYGPGMAAKLGIRVVYQELSLCTNLKISENFLIEQPGRIKGWTWRKHARQLTQEALDRVFPNHGIQPSKTVEDLTIAHRQMVEISRAASDPNLKLLILDEPTSSLDSEQTAQLLAFMEKAKKDGTSFIYISHRLKEVLHISDKIVVMQNGQLTWTGSTSEVDEAELVRKMGSGVPEPEQQVKNRTTFKADVTARELKIQTQNLTAKGLKDVNISLRAGEIVGIAGLEGSGQRDLLHALFQHKRTHSVNCTGKVAYVSGDRSKEGVFPYWSILKNITLTKLTWPGAQKSIQFSREREWAQYWFDRLKMRAPNVDAPLVSLSGGNQQKALIARALLSDADIVLLDDPTRGVDVDTKRQLYQLAREEAEKGRLIVWYSTEDEEFAEFDRVYVLRSGHVVKELVGDDITKDNIITASFTHIDDRLEQQKERSNSKVLSVVKQMAGQRVAMPLVALVAILIAMAVAKPDSVTPMGLTLLVGTAIPLVLSALSQMFVIAGSDIDLGVGAYIGLINAVTATILVKQPLFGVFLMIIGIIAYGVLGALIHLRKIPAIVVTLGASFVWLGAGISLLPQPGGSAPTWLMNFFNLNTPLIPEPVLFVLLVGLIAFLILRSRYGTVLRGFGNNGLAVERSGWSTLKARVTLYMLTGLFGTLAGLSITGISTAADPNATSSYTLLTVAAVVMGGGELMGGIVDAFGVVFGALALSLLGALLGLINVGSTYQPAVQGALLFAILAIRLITRRRSA